MWNGEISEKHGLAVIKTEVKLLRNNSDGVELIVICQAIDFIKNRHRLQLRIPQYLRNSSPIGN